LKKIRIRSGGSVNVLDKFDLPVDGEINFSSEEFEWAKRLSNDLRDPESQKSFWESVLERKRQYPNYSLFTDFPIEKKEVDMSVGQKICQETIDMLKGRRTSA
jgi:hypothetical protein